MASQPWRPAKNPARLSKPVTAHVVDGVWERTTLEAAWHAGNVSFLTRTSPPRTQPAHPRPQPLSLQPQCHVRSAVCGGRPVLSISSIPNQIQSRWTGNSSRWKLRPAPPAPCQCQARLSPRLLQVMDRDLPNRWICSCHWMRRSSQALSPRGDSECGVCHVFVLRR